jgi:hypothetical protein
MSPAFSMSLTSVKREFVPLRKITARVFELVEAAGLTFHRATILALGGVLLSEGRDRVKGLYGIRKNQGSADFAHKTNL